MQTFEEIAKEIIYHKNYQKTKELKHHRSTVYNHSHHVGKVTYAWSKKLKLDYISATRGALLHDYYLYSKEDTDKRSIFKGHLKLHPKEAYKNARKDFGLNKIEEDVIKCHMFPITLSLPKTKEGWVIVIVDKVVSVYEWMPFYTNPCFA